jgi:transcriptional regulator with PAS, ATPase and Fis domain
VHPPELARAVDLDGDAVIGRATGDEPGGTNLAHPTLSRRHLAIRWERSAARFLAEDLGSKNGSWIDGQSLSGAPRLISDGAVIRAGEVLMVHEVDPAPAAGDAREALEAVPGDSRAARALRAQVVQAAADPAHVLLIGETGTGKEHIAREIHRLSGRTGPFRPISCAELSPELMASQLFGHARGAFTGAHQAQPGLFRDAAGGTILLDEIGELPLELQGKLLRVLQEGEVLPIGEGKAVPVDVRVIAATNRDLDVLVERGDFRRDLFARLAYWEIAVPPLRARRADILAWVHRLHGRFAGRRSADPTPLALGAEAADTVLRAHWADNLRGLDRLVHRLAAVRRPPGAVISAADVAPFLRAPPTGTATPAPAWRVQRRRAPTRAELEGLLDEHGSVRAVAAHLGCDRRQIYRWMKSTGLRR